MVLVCAPGHRLAGQRQIALADLDGEGFIGFDDNLTIRREIDRVLHQHQLDVRYAMEFDNIETIKRAIEINAGVGLLPEPTVVSEVESGRLIAVPLACNELVRPLGIICRRGKELSATAKLFIEHLHKEGTEVDSSADSDFSPESGVDDSNGQDAAATASAGQGSNGHAAAKGASGDA
jgi:DNA-binding transcriptional LysR family regulator